MVKLEERKRFSRFTDADAALLADLRPTFEAHADRIVEQFYAHLLEFEPLRPLLADAALVQRLKGFQKTYLLSLTNGTYGEAYVEDRLRIGRTHERIGLTPQWYVGTYCLYLELLCPLVHEHFPGGLERATQACLALSKLIHMDIQIVLDTYYQTRQQKALEKSEQLAAVGELAASIAHEVRNPLAGIKGAMQILRKGLQAEPAQAEVMDEVVGQIGRLENLVRDLLRFARPTPLDRQALNLHALLDRSLRLVQEGTSAPITVERAYAPEAEEVTGDPQQLEQVFLNLIQNALQAMETGGTLRLTTSLENGVIRIAVQDSGKGIAPPDLARIFQPFFTTKHRGSGLGLSIVKKIVEAHGGGLTVGSLPGEGTTVMVTLPRHGAS